MTQITKVRSAYERGLLTVEGKTLNEWNGMSKKEREQSKSFQDLLEILKECNEQEIAEIEAALENPDLVEGELKVHERKDGSTHNSWKPYMCKGMNRKRLENCNERNYEEAAHERLEAKIEDLLKQSDDGHFFTIVRPSRAERGFALMEENDWEYIYLHYYGGHDSGGIEEATLLRKDGTETAMDWECEDIRKKCPRILTWNTNILYPKVTGQGQTVASEVSVFFVKKEETHFGGRPYWHSPAHSLSTTIDNPITDAVGSEFHSWAGDWSADGTLVWDLRKKVDGEKNPDYRVKPSLNYEITEYVHKTETIENSV